MRLRGLKAEPDLVVVANLWSDNNFDSFVDKELLAQYGDYKESLTGRMKSTLAYSNIYRVLDWRIRVKKSHEKLRDQIQKVGWMIGTGNPTGRRRVEINDYAANLETLTQMALANDAEVLFLVLANREDFNEGKRPQDLAWFEYRQVMRDTAARHGAMVIDIPAVFGDSGYSIEELFIDEMHPTVLGHRLMGEALAEALAGADWANGGSVMGSGDGSAIRSIQIHLSAGTAAQVVVMRPSEMAEGSLRRRRSNHMQLMRGPHSNRSHRTGRFQSTSEGMDRHERLVRFVPNELPGGHVHSKVAGLRPPRGWSQQHNRCIAHQLSGWRGVSHSARFANRFAN